MSAITIPASPERQYTTDPDNNFYNFENRCRLERPYTWACIDSMRFVTRAMREVYSGVGQPWYAILYRHIFCQPLPRYRQAIEKLERIHTYLISQSREVEPRQRIASWESRGVL